MNPGRAGLLIAIALVTQAATITITNEDLPKASAPPGRPTTATAPATGATLWLGAINRQRSLRGLTTVELDPVLGEAARRLAEFVRSQPDTQRQSIPAKRLLEAYWQAGATDGNPTWRVVTQDAAVAPGPGGGFRLGSALEGDLSHIGVGSVVQDGTRWTVIVAAKRRILLAGTGTGQRNPYERLYLRGKLLPGYFKPQLMLTRPDGQVREMPLSTSDTQFEHILELDGLKGRYMVEIMVGSRWGPAVAALFPLDVGMAHRVTQVVATDDSRLSLADKRLRMLNLINADRRRFQLAPVALNERLSQMAQGHSEDMKQHRFFAHTSPTTGSLEDRAKAIGIKPMTLGENIAVSGSLTEAEEGLMASPAHRSMILDPQMQVVGIGITLSDPGERGPVRYWVTQNYAVHEPD
jgi:uncharacterized protein YkwD